LKNSNPEYLKIYGRWQKRIWRLRKKLKRGETLSPLEWQYVNKKAVDLANAEYERLQTPKPLRKHKDGISPVLYGGYTPSTKEYNLQISKDGKIKLT
jgi:hypothetical protein